MSDPFQRLASACNATFGVPVVYTSEDGVQTPILWSFWERSPESALDNLRQPHEGPVAEVPFPVLPTRPNRGDSFASTGRLFTVKKAVVDRSGLMWLIELAEDFP